MGRMAKQRTYTLKQDELEAVEAVIDQSREARMVKRAVALRMLHQGHKPPAVAATLRVTVTTIYDWCKRWETQGVAGLAHRPKAGRPRKATVEYQQALSEAVERDPTSYGYSFTVWTLERLRDHLAHSTAMHLSTGRFAALLADMDYVYRRPKPDLAAKQNAEAKERASTLLAALKKEQHKTIASFSLWTKPR